MSKSKTGRKVINQLKSTVYQHGSSIAGKGKMSSALWTLLVGSMGLGVAGSPQSAAAFLCGAGTVTKICTGTASTVLFTSLTLTNA
ncbi:MAG: hypothetical protein IID52_05320, partial [Proteobacteria bacterium]|nr:hypothetical protein [Pseudomonadota bacterium]